MHPTRFPVAIAILGAALIALLTAAVTMPPSDRSLPPIPPVSTSIQVAKPLTASRDVQRAAFFDAEVGPQIVAADELNRLAADRCIERLKQVVDSYRDGVKPFVDDLTSVSTRLGIAKRLPGSWWREDRRIDRYVQGKFEKHLFSEEQLARDIAAVLQDFKNEIDANQKRMLVNVRASLTSADLPEVTIDEYEPFFETVAADLHQYSTAQGTISVYQGLTTIVVSEAGSYLVVSVVNGLLARFGTAAATNAATGAGATATAGVAGAGGGSFIGPVGTVVGFGVGLAVGLAIDWWMTEQFEQQLNQQMLGYLDSLEETLLHGASTPVIDSDSSPFVSRAGFVEALPVVCDDLLSAYRERFYQQIVHAEPSWQRG